MPGWLQAEKTNRGVCWYARWWDGGTKRKRRIGIVPRRDAERALQVIGRDLQLAPFGLQKRERITLRDFVEQRWLPHRAVRPTTAARDGQVLRAHIYPALGNTRIDSITVEEVDRLMSTVKQKTSAGTAKRTLAVIRRALNDARRYGLISENPAAQAQVDTPRRPLRLLSLEQVASAIAAVPASYRDIVATAALTGLRWGELVALTWPDIELEPPIARVTKQVPAGLGKLTGPKSFAGNRVVDLQPLVRDILLDRGLTHQANMLYNDRYYDQLVFPGHFGGYLNYRFFIRHIWKPSLKAAGLPDIRWHDLRHFYASLLIALGHDYLYVARQLGHSSPTVTLSVYAHAFEEQKRGAKLDRDGAMAKLTGAFRGVLA